MAANVDPAMRVAAATAVPRNRGEIQLSFADSLRTAAHHLSIVPNDALCMLPVHFEMPVSRLFRRRRIAT
jgi:hypothetical protein